jgi:hypothetical protein
LILLRSEVFQTDQITSQLEYKPTGKIIHVHNSRLHITENKKTEAFQIYVPKDAKARELCYLRILPAALLDRLFGGDSTGLSSTKRTQAVSVISQILNGSDLVVEDVLHEAGIVSTPAKSGGLFGSLQPWQLSLDDNIKGIEASLDAIKLNSLRPSDSTKETKTLSTSAFTSGLLTSSFASSKPGQGLFGSSANLASGDVKPSVGLSFGTIGFGSSTNPFTSESTGLFRSSSTSSKPVPRSPFGSAANTAGSCVQPPGVRFGPWSQGI